MQHNVHYTACPVCGSNQIVLGELVTDYTVSKETFHLMKCSNCTAQFTQDIPNSDQIGQYYAAASYVSHTDTTEGLINKLYHWVRNYTLQQKKKLLVKVTGLKSGKLLDVGAGTGYFSATMQQAGWEITALEPDAQARNVAFTKYGLTLQESTNLFQLPKNQFDAITLWHVLEHVHDLHAYMQQFFEVLKSNGKLIVAVPNYTSYDAQLYGKYWAAYDVPRHLYHFSPLSMQHLALQYGFEIESHYPMWFDSVYVSMLSETYKTGNSGLLKAIINGCISNIKALNKVEKCSSVIYILTKK